MAEHRMDMSLDFWLPSIKLPVIPNYFMRVTVMSVMPLHFTWGGGGECCDNSTGSLPRGILPKNHMFLFLR